jgi:hypothetical protein
VHLIGNLLLGVLAAVGLALTTMSVHVATQPDSTTVVSAQDRPGAEEVARAIEALRADPNLAAERTITTLRWKDDGEKKTTGRSWLSAWIIGLFGWFASSARVLIWGAAIALALALIIYIARLVRARETAVHETPFVAPTHVGDLDIRPETLPADIGAAARALWDRGEHRAALALLYRGLLSRLAHVHRVPIRDSTTEGDCLSLSRQLAPPASDYTRRLVTVWQRAVYGSDRAEPTIVYALCDDFAAALGTASRAETATEGAA